MAVKIGTTSGASNGAVQIGLTQDADEKEDFNKEYAVGSYAPGMQIVIEGVTGVYTVNSSQLDVDENVLINISPGLANALDSESGPFDVFKVYEGAHSTIAEQSRKRLLGYI